MRLTKIVCVMLMSTITTFAFSQQDKELEKYIKQEVKQLKKDGWKVIDCNGITIALGVAYCF